MAGISTLGQALTQMRLLNDQNLLLNNLTTQLATGKKTQAFSGLESDVLSSKRARATFTSLETYTNNITNSERRIKLTLDAIEEFQVQAENFANALVGFTQESVHQEGAIIEYDDPTTPDVNEAIRVGLNSGEPDVDLETLQDLASNIYDVLVDLINDKDGNRFLLGGADSLTQPLTDTGTLDAAISSLLGNWKDETLPPATNLTSDELISALTSRTFGEDPNAITDTTIGYSAALSAGNAGEIFVRVDEKTEIEYTALANDQAFRDILVAAAYFKSDDLGPIADVYAEPYTLGDPTLQDGAPGATLDEQKENFYQVFNALTASVNQALDNIDKVRFKLENARVRLDIFKRSHEESQAALLNTISDVEDADTTEVALQIQTLQVSLDASYRVTALTSELSLARFIS